MHFFSRKKTELDGKWLFQADPMDVGEREIPFLIETPDKNGTPHNFETNAMTPIDVPGDWNHLKGFENYEGIAWYCLRFQVGTIARDSKNRNFLHFEGVNHSAKIFLNGKQVGKQNVPFLPFSIEVTGKLNASNFIAVRIDNTRSDLKIPAFQYDWFNYGGILRSVSVVSVPKTFVSDVVIKTSIRAGHVVATFNARINGPDVSQIVNIGLKETGFKTTIKLDSNGKGSATGFLQAKPWSPTEPNIYTMQVSCGTDSYEDKIGFRTVEADADEVKINGQPVWLRGISMHEEVPGKGGRSLTQKDVDNLLGTAKELGCNFIRLAHYPHTEMIARTADKLGLLVWEEIPVYWRPDFKDKGVLKMAQESLKTLIHRDINRPSVIFWSVANETPPKGNTDRNKMLKNLVAYTRKQDPSRLVTMATMVGEDAEPGAWKVEDIICREVDVVGLNEYIGWYSHKPSELDEINLKYEFKKPLIISETGGGAPKSNKGKATDRWTEEFQAAIYEGQIELWKRTPKCIGASPWILMDFKSPMRQNDLQKGYNRKGLVDAGLKKKMAFKVLQKFYLGLAKEAGEEIETKKKPVKKSTKKVAKKATKKTTKTKK